VNIVVMGVDGELIAADVSALQAMGHRAAGFVGDDVEEAQAMGIELFGSVDEVRVWTLDH
jgi:hypothetical protein